MFLTRIALAVGLGLSGVSVAQAAIVSFTQSTLSGASSVLDGAVPSYAGSNLCASHGTCSTALTYQTDAGKLTVTAQDGADVDQLALVNHSKHNNAGLGVVTGYEKHGKFVIADGNLSLSSHKETLTLSFDSQVFLSQLFFFPDDRSAYDLTHELDKFDGFTLSIDGGKFVEYSFGVMGGQPVTFGTPLIGSTFTFGYARHMSGEDYYLAGLNVGKVTPAVPEASSAAMLAIGLIGVAAMARRRMQA